jgi:hypothetical protein
MRSLRFAYFWLAGGITLLAVVLYLTLAPVGGPDFAQSDKFGHLMAFAVLMVWFCGVFRANFTVYVALGLLAFGVLIEYLQGLTDYRSAEVADAAFDFIGILLGWGLAVAGLSRWAAKIESWLPGRT